MTPEMRTNAARSAAFITALITGVGFYFLFQSEDGPNPRLSEPTGANAQATSMPSTVGDASNSVNLSDPRLDAVEVEPVGEHELPVE